MWTFSFCSNARSFDRPHRGKFGRENQSSNFYQAQGRGCFPPCSCGWWLVDGLQVSAVMRSFQLLQGFQRESVPYCWKKQAENTRIWILRPTVIPTSSPIATHGDAARINSLTSFIAIKPVTSFPFFQQKTQRTPILWAALRLSVWRLA